MYNVKVPYGFIRDCEECDCDIGEYAKGRLTASSEQMSELRSRAAHYAHEGTDAAPAGLVRSSRALLKALGTIGL